MTQHLDLDALQAAAEAATPGPWEAVQKFAGSVVAGPMQEYMNGSARSQIMMAVGAEWMREGETQANAAFIAAFNPQTILALIDRLRKAEAASKWQPIETAPQDGTRILAFVPWCDGPQWEVGAFLCGDFFPANRGYCSVTPICWQPLPAAPTSADSEGEKG